MLLVMSKQIRQLRLINQKNKKIKIHELRETEDVKIINSSKLKDFAMKQ